MVFGWNGYSRQQINRATRTRNIELRRQQTEDVEEKDRPRTNGILYWLLEFTGSLAAVDPHTVERLNVGSTQE